MAKRGSLKFLLLKTMKGRVYKQLSMDRKPFKSLAFEKNLLGDIMRLLFLCLILFSHGLLFCKAKPTTLKVLVTYDASKTALHEYYQLDGLRMEKNFRGIAAQTNLIPDIQVVQLHRLTPRKLRAWIKGLTEKDVAAFYYAGKENFARGSKWPYLPLAKRRNGYAFPQDKLTKAMAKKHPYLTLVLFDCYSKVLHFSKNSFAVSDVVPLQKVPDSGNLPDLFTDSPGVVSGCSVRHGETGFAVYQGGPIGGIFTTELQNNFYGECFSGNSFWGDIGEDVKFGCSKLSRKRQYPMMCDHVHDPDQGPFTRK